MGALEQALAVWLEAGGREMGEIAIARAGPGFELRHRADTGLEDLAAFAGPRAARELSLYDDAGKFRPLKTAPNLRRGWRLALADVPALRAALDYYFYPAMLGVWLSHHRATLPPVPLRETLNRQTGMYRVTQKITDAQADALLGRFCRLEDGCLKKILWPLAPGVPVTTLSAEKLAVTDAARSLPLLCHEACNLLVAQAREVVKAPVKSA